MECIIWWTSEAKITERCRRNSPRRRGVWLPKWIIILLTHSNWYRLMEFWINSNLPLIPVMLTRAEPCDCFICSQARLHLKYSTNGLSGTTQTGSHHDRLLLGWGTSNAPTDRKLSAREVRDRWKMDEKSDWDHPTCATGGNELITVRWGISREDPLLRRYVWIVQTERNIHRRFKILRTTIYALLLARQAVGSPMPPIMRHCL